MSLFNRCPNNGGLGLRHNWSDIHYEVVASKEGVEYIGPHIKYRVCNNCHKMQEHLFSSQGFYWSDLNPQERTIINRLIVKDSLNDSRLTIPLSEEYKKK